MSLNLPTERHKAFVLLGLLTDISGLEKFLPFLSPLEKDQCLKVLADLKKNPKGLKKQVVLDELRRLASESRSSSLLQVHPDWLLESLSHEKPRMVATILRHLPGQHVSYLLDRLPQSLVTALPSIAQTFSLDPELSQVIKKRFERRFRPRPLRPGQEPSIVDVMAASPGSKLYGFFRKIGFKEVSLAFAALNEKSIAFILHRLPPADAEELKKYLASPRNAGDARCKQAQNHLLSLDLQGPSAENLVLEAGFCVFSKSVLPENLDAVRAIQYKFPVGLSETLKRYIDKNLPLNSEKTVGPYREEIGKMVSSSDG